MNRQQHLLVIAAEECNEAAHRVAKILRFGLDDVEPGQELMNAEQLSVELAHVIAMAQMLTDEGMIIAPTQADVQQKIVNVEHWLLHAKMQGTLTA